METLKELRVNEGQKDHLLQCLDVAVKATNLGKGDAGVHLHIVVLLSDAMKRLADELMNVDVPVLPEPEMSRQKMETVRVFVGSRDSQIFTLPFCARLLGIHERMRSQAVLKFALESLLLKFAPQM